MESKNILQYLTILWISNAQCSENWLYFVNDNGTNYVMNFSSVPNDTHEMQFGDAYFYLYTRTNWDQSESITVPDSRELNIKNFNKSNEIKVITHGWLSSESVNWIQKMKNSILREYDLNVITVDWSELSGNIVYPFAAFSTRYVGKRVANLLNALMNSYNIGGDEIHLIGHSLGAHVMGYAGLFSNEKIFRITGLDPARPLFEIPAISPDFHLDKNDAQFVDILHTCAGILGYRQSFGHADFYPNNGKPTQPGCNGVQQVVNSCSHGRSHEYFEESIEYKYDKGFIAYPCESWEKFDNGECRENSTHMGYHTHWRSSGDYYLRTRNESKYADS